MRISRRWTANGAEAMLIPKITGWDMKLRPLLLACVIATPAFISAAPTWAAVTRLMAEKATPMAGGYELLEGHFRGALDTNDKHNSQINDLRFPALGASGRVEYSATFAIALPTGAISGVLVYDVPNRGRGAAMAIGDGHVHVVSGWQADLDEGPVAQPINAPSAPLTGPAYVRFLDMPAGTTTMPVKGGPQGNQGGRAFDVATASGARLFTGVSDDRPNEQKEVSSSDWAFADFSAIPIPCKPDLTKLCSKGGFDPKHA